MRSQLLNYLRDLWGFEALFIFPPNLFFPCFYPGQLILICLRSLTLSSDVHSPVKSIQWIFHFKNIFFSSRTSIWSFRFFYSLPRLSISLLRFSRTENPFSFTSLISYNSWFKILICKCHYLAHFRLWMCSIFLVLCI